ncbi:unnamed protein product [Soboliphyme baturini]|uniref:ELFV_dehydrog domain-containing protein n=1 Tax=Soboliphyme baturini TaxID=241478 RepID=A0A183J620_9BILA|nr:unnamed protein product [Soboliphyme baturini]
MRVSSKATINSFVSAARQLLETAMVINYDPSEPCPKVIAPVDVGTNIALGKMFGFEGFVRGYTPKRGAFGTNANLQLALHNLALDAGGWQAVVENRATGCSP